MGDGQRPRQRQLAWLKWGGAAGWVVGGILFIAGFVLLSNTLDIPRDERVRQLQPMTAAELHTSAAGQEVLVEGRIGPETPVREHGFVAFRYQHDAGTYRPNWRTIETVRPVLVVAVADGSIRVQGNYRMLNMPVTHYEAQGEDAYRYAGFVVDSPVLLVGAVQQGADGSDSPVVEADLLYGGTRAAFLAGEQRAEQWGDWLAPRLIGAGVVSLCVAFWGSVLVRVVVGIVRWVR